MEALQDLFGLGLEPKDLGVLQVCSRGIIVFLFALVIVRTAHKRFMSRMTAFDAVLGLILASTLARCINGSAPFLPTLAVGFVLALLHRLLAAIAFHWAAFGRLIKGRPDLLVRNGEPDNEKLRIHRISEEDLLEEARLNGQLETLREIRVAMLERDGKISIVPARQR